MRTRSAAPALLALACLVGGAGCSDDGGSAGPEVSEDEQPFVDSMADDILDHSRASEDEAGCLAATTVSAYGASAFEAADVDPDAASFNELPKDEMTLEEAEALVDELGECVDLAEFFAGTLAEQGGESGLSDDDIDCLADAFDEEMLDVVLPSSFTSEFDTFSAESNDAFTELSEACPEAVAAMQSEAEVKFESVGEAIGEVDE
jgi:hypothetical protein